MINYVEFHTELKKGLARFPGDRELLKDALDVADRLLEASELDKALAVLETALLHAKDSPLLVDLRERLKFTHAWLAARRAANQKNWQAAAQALSPFPELGTKYSLGLMSDLRNWEKTALQEADFESTKALYGYHGQIRPNDKDSLNINLKN